MTNHERESGSGIEVEQSCVERAADDVFTSFLKLILFVGVVFCGISFSLVALMFGGALLIPGSPAGGAFLIVGLIVTTVVVWNAFSECNPPPRDGEGGRHGAG